MGVGGHAGGLQCWRETGGVPMVSVAIALAFVPLVLALALRSRHWAVLVARVALGWLRDRLSSVPREHRALQYLLTHAVPGDPRHVLLTLDQWSRRCEHLSCVGPEKGQHWRQRPQRVLELGTSCGYGAVLLARALPPGARLLTVERDPQRAAMAEKVIRLAGFDERTLQLIVGPSEEVIPQLRSRCYELDLRLLERHRLLAPGATVMADHVLCRERRGSCATHAASGRFRCRLHRATLEYCQGITDGIAELRYTGRDAGGDATGTGWEWGGNTVGMGWERGGNGVGIGWEHSGNGVGMGSEQWEWGGNGVGKH
uniref:catechol O-methyltransferase n=1 Tax=Melopsittacus undulatus TaxID=13146 RepID=A0A8V5GVN0_MELUD